MDALKKSVAADKGARPQAKKNKERIEGQREMLLPAKWIKDEFSRGRGTTNFAARLFGMPTFGIDSSRIAVAATSAKLVNGIAPADIVMEARSILERRSHVESPHGTFWRLAYRPVVLNDLCKLADLRKVWRNVADVSDNRARLVFRFGAINDRLVDPREVIFQSLLETPWRLRTIVDAGTARLGKRNQTRLYRAPKHQSLNSMLGLAENRKVKPRTILLFGCF